MKKFIAAALVLVLLFAAFSSGYYIGHNQRGFAVELNKETVTGVPVPRGPEPVELLNLNTATASQLMTLPGIGQKLAEAIVSFREKNGDFQTVWELVAVEGIGDGKLEKIAPYLSID